MEHDNKSHARKRVPDQIIHRKRNSLTELLRTQPLSKPSIKKILLARGIEQYVHRSFEYTAISIEGLSIPVKVAAIEPVEDHSIIVSVLGADIILPVAGKIKDHAVNHAALNIIEGVQYQLRGEMLGKLGIITENNPIDVSQVNSG